MKLEIERKPAEEGRFAGISEVTGHRGDVKVKVATENVHRSDTLVTAFDLLFDSLECHCAIQLRNRAVFVVATPLELATAAARAWIVPRNSIAIHVSSLFNSHVDQSAQYLDAVATRAEEVYCIIKVQEE